MERGRPSIEKRVETASSVGLPREELLAEHRAFIDKHTAERGAQGYLRKRRGHGRGLVENLGPGRRPSATAPRGRAGGRRVHGKGRWAGCPRDATPRRSEVGTDGCEHPFGAPRDGPDAAVPSGIERARLAVGAAAVLAPRLTITANVLGRALSGISLPDTVAIVREPMVAAIVLPPGFATAARAHVAVEFVSDQLPPRGRSTSRALGSAVGAPALLPLLWAGWHELAHDWSTGGLLPGDLDPPRRPIRALFLLGMAVCRLRVIAPAWGAARTVGSGGVLAPDPDARKREG